MLIPDLSGISEGIQQAGGALAQALHQGILEKIKRER